MSPRSCAGDFFAAVTLEGEVRRPIGSMNILMDSIAFGSSDIEFVILAKRGAIQFNKCNYGLMDSLSLVENDFFLPTVYFLLLTITRHSICPASLYLRSKAVSGASGSNDSQEIFAWAELAVHS